MPKKKWGKYRFQYLYCCPGCAAEVTPYYYAAFNCINWSIPGKRIGGRKRPLSPNTIKRIEYGIYKYWDHRPAFFNPFMIKTDHMQMKGDVSKSVDQPAYTQTSKHNMGFVTPPFITTSRGQSKAHSSLKALTTQSQMINHGVVLPFIAENKGKSTSREISDPLSTLTTKDYHGVVMPFVVEMNRTGKARAVDQPISTILAGGNHHALVTDEALTSFLTYYYGSAQASHISEPAGTISTNDRMALVNYRNPENLNVDDCYYRMIKPHEVQAGMAFPDSYIVLGNSRDKVKQCGNAVTPPAMKVLIERCVESLR